MALPLIFPPSSLPQFSANDHGIALEDAYSAVPRGRGHGRLRPSSTATPRTVSVRWTLTAAQTADLDDWFENALVAGTEHFTAAVAFQGPHGLLYWDACWVEPYDAEPVPTPRGLMWQITGSLRLSGIGYTSRPSTGELATEIALALLASASIFSGTTPLATEIDLALLPSVSLDTEISLPLLSLLTPLATEITVPLTGSGALGSGGGTGGTGTTLTIEELDGTPSATPAKLIFPDDSLEIDSNGDVLVTFPSGGSVIASDVSIVDAGTFYTGTDVEAALQELGPFAGKTLDTDGTLAANSDTRVATQKAVKTYADQLIAAADAMVFKGVIDCSANPNYPAADKGWTYRVSVAGKIGGASGTNVEAGDLLLCLADSTASGNQATVGSSWSIAQANLDGAVIGPASVTDSHFAQFDGPTGKLIKGGLALDTDTTLAANSDTRVASQKAVKAYADAFAPAAIANLRIVANVSGGSALPAAYTLSAILDAIASSTRGSVLARAASGWVARTPSNSGYVLTFDGTDTDFAAAGTGLSAIADQRLLANISGSSAIPTATTLTALIDNILGSTQGQILTRNATVWTVLNPGTSGYFLKSQGAGANLMWDAAAAGGTAVGTTITDAGNYYTGTEVETALQEVGASLATLSASTGSGVNLQTGSGTYTAVLSDATKIEIQRSNSSANNVTIPPHSSVAFPIGTQLGIRMTGTGQTSVVAGGGVTVNSLGSLNLQATGALAIAIQTATDVWWLTGELLPTVTYKTFQQIEAANGTTAGTTLGIVITSSTTVSHPAQAQTNIRTAIRRINWATTTVAGQNTGFFEAAATKAQGSSSLGGYTCVFRFALPVNTTGYQCFVGLGAAAALTGDPSALTSMIGMGFDAADSSGGNWQLMRNDASGTATRVDLGSSAARNTSSVYKLTLRAYTALAGIYVTVVNEETGVVVLDTNYSTDIPPTATFLAARAQIRNGAVAAAAQLDVAHYDAGMQE